MRCNAGCHTSRVIMTPWIRVFNLRPTTLIAITCPYIFPLRHCWGGSLNSLASRKGLDPWVACASSRFNQQSPIVLVVTVVAIVVVTVV